MAHMKTENTRISQEALDARIEARMRWYKDRMDGSVVSMLGVECLGGSVSPLKLNYRYVSEAWMRNPAGVTHGGMLATMLDNAMGITARIVSPSEGIAPTAELHVSYLRPVPVDTAIRIAVSVDQISSRMIRMRAKLWLEGDEDTLCVTGQAVYCPRPGARAMEPLQ